MRRAIDGIGWIVVVISLAAAAPARASGGWLAPVTLASEAEEVRFGPYVAMDADGEAASVWQGAEDEALRLAGGAWEPAGSLTGEANGAGDPCIAMSSSGEALAVWSSAGGAARGFVIDAAGRPPGGRWGTPAQVAQTPEGIVRIGGCQVAVDAAGDAVAVWSLETEFEFMEVWADYRPAGGSWLAPVQLRGAINPEASPAVAIDSSGDAVAAWIGSGFAIQAIYKPAGMDWSEPKSPTEAETLSPSGHAAFDPQVAIDGAGEAVAVWDLYDGEHYVVQTASRSRSGSWAAASDLSQTSESALDPALAADSEGEALAVWERGSVIEAAHRRASEPWEEVGTISDNPVGVSAHAPSVAMNSSGGVVAAWEIDGGASFSVSAAVDTADEGWQQPKSISASVEHGELFPQVAVDARGDALAVWELDEEGHFLVQAASYESGEVQLPEVGRCERLGGSALGVYASDSCTSRSAGADSGRFEWLPWPSAHGAFALKGGAATLRAGGGTTVRCRASTGDGEYSGAQGALLALTFRGCEATGSSSGACSSEGAASGEVRTSALEGRLSSTSSGRSRASWALAPVPSSPQYVASFSCARMPLWVTGAVAASASPTNKMAATSKWSVKGVLAMTASLTAEEALELRVK